MNLSSTTDNNNNRLNLFFTGDFCIYKQTNIDAKLSKLIKSHDFRIVNWEAPIIKESYQKINKAGPCISQSNDYKKILESGIFNVFSLANNHIFDYGELGLTNTLKELSIYGETVGAGLNFNDVYKPMILKHGEMSVCIISCAENQFGCLTDNYSSRKSGYAWINSFKIMELIKTYRSQVNHMILLPHCGLEMNLLPLPEWRELYHSFIDLGIDLIIGTHPHIIQPKEIYKGKTIYYSIGNFIFNNDFKDDSWYQSLGLSCQINRDEIKINEYWIDSSKNCVKLIECSEKFKENCEILTNDSKYINQINEDCISHWNLYMEMYFDYSSSGIKLNKDINSYGGIIRKILVRIIQKFVSKPKKDQVLLYHNLAIETNRFCAERALKLLNKIV